MNNNADEIKILIVDDEEDNRLIARYYLNKLGYKNIVEAENGIKVIEYINTNNSADVIFLDRMLPNMSGLEIARFLRRSERNKGIIIIFQTGKAQTDELEDVLDVSVYHLIRKPYDESHMKYFFSVFTEMVKRKRFIQHFFANQESPKIINEVNNLKNALNFSAAIAKLYRPSVTIAEAIYQLIANGIEHGILNLTREDKLSAYDSNNYIEFIDKKLQNNSKSVSLKVSIDENYEELSICIKDPGSGFEFENLLFLTPDMLLSPFGKNIAICERTLDGLEYSEGGTRIIAKIHREHSEN